MDNVNTKYYVGSDGIAKDISTLETTHLTNALAKQYRELFNSKNKKDYSQRLETINNLKEDLYKRFNTFYEGLDDDEQ